jgi:hypothetical protein
MASELTCTQIEQELSARLDDEAEASLAEAVDQHLATCTSCKRYQERLWVVRRAVRAQAVGPVPDLSNRILEGIGGGEPVRLDRRRERLRYAFVGAAASMALLIATAIPWSTDPPDSATAAELVSGIRSAARGLEAYSATFEMIERGWHPDVNERAFEVDLAYEAPERMRLVVRDRTAYPSSRWPRNNVVLVSDGSELALEEPSTCPRAALPRCAQGTTERSTLIHRQPFDGIHRVPTDAILPLKALASSDGLEVTGMTTVLGHRAHGVTIPYSQAVPLISGLQAGGTWRTFHPADEVEVQLDAATWFPLGLRVRATDSPERREWAIRNSYEDDPGDVLLEVRVTSLSETSPRADAFVLPDNPKARIRDGGFREVAKREVDRRLVPDRLSGMLPYRWGRSAGATIATWTDGMTYVKVIEQPTSGARDHLVAEEVDLSGVGPAYYEPATEHLPRRVSLLSGRSEVRLESNLPRAELLSIAASMSLRSRRMPAEMVSGKGTALQRLRPQALTEIYLAPEPSYLPSGYKPRVALLSHTPDGRTTLRVHYSRAEAEFGGIQITRSNGAEMLPPSSEDLVATMITPEISARWSTERSELEWIAGSTHTVVTVPGFGMATALRIARSL